METDKKITFVIPKWTSKNGRMRPITEMPLIEIELHINAFDRLAGMKYNEAFAYGMMTSAMYKNYEPSKTNFDKLFSEVQTAGPEAFLPPIYYDLKSELDRRERQNMS